MTFRVPGRAIRTLADLSNFKQSKVKHLLAILYFIYRSEHLASEVHPFSFNEHFVHPSPSLNWLFVGHYNGRGCDRDLFRTACIVKISALDYKISSLVGCSPVTDLFRADVLHQAVQ